MEIVTTKDLFDYLNSLDGGKVKQSSKSCSIWLPNGVLLEGKAVDQIGNSSVGLIDKSNSFIYNDDQIASLDTFDMKIFSPKAENFLNQIFKQFPSITPIEYKIKIQFSELEHAFKEIQFLRVKIGRLNVEYENMQQNYFKLLREKEFKEDEINLLKHNKNFIGTNIVNTLIALLKFDPITNFKQLKAIHSFVIKFSKTNKIIIKTGFKDSIVQLSYQVERWGTADLEGIHLGFDENIIFFNSDGEIIDNNYPLVNSSISFGWDELCKIISYDKNKAFDL
jgi:hypothetical protein